MKGKADIKLAITTVILVIFGVIMVYSASMYSAQYNYGNKYFFMYKQILGGVLGIAAMILLSFVDYHVLEKLKYPILGVSFALLILVFVPGIGIESYGAKRWINFPFFSMQASEVAKFGFIIFAASYIAKNHKKMTSFVTLLPVLAVGGAICVLIILEPNMSITLCMIMLMFVMLYIGERESNIFS